MNEDKRTRQAYRERELVTKVGQDRTARQGGSEEGQGEDGEAGTDKRRHDGEGE